jgi:hypothetical protein
MAVSKKEALEIGLLALGGLAIFALLAKTGAPQPTIVANASGNAPIAPGRAYGAEYYLYNYPQVEGPPGADMGIAGANGVGVVPSSTTGGGLPTCGCTGVSQGEFGTLGRLTSFFETTLEGIASGYKDNVLSVVPDFFRQYINNSTGAALSQNSAAFFSG